MIWLADNDDSIESACNCTIIKPNKPSNVFILTYNAVDKKDERDEINYKIYEKMSVN